MRSVFAALILCAGCVGAGDDENCPFEKVDQTDVRFNVYSLDCTYTHTTEICDDPECCMGNVETTYEKKCEGGCFDDDEAACEADTTCFQTRDPEAFFKGTDAFTGCYQVPSSSTTSETPCRDRTTIEDCVAPRAGDRCVPLVLSRTATLFECVSEAAVADACDAPVTCTDPAPSCGSGAVPAIVNGCYYGCIEQDWCR